MRESRGPKLRHGNVIRPFAFKTIDIMSVKRTARFRMGSKAVLVRQLTEASIIVLRHEVGQRTSIIPLETLCDFLIGHGLTRQCREGGYWIVSSAGAEIFNKARRPGGAANFPAIDMHVLQRAPGQ